MPHGLGHKARHDAARSEARTPTRVDSTDPRYWPAPAWTHKMADEAAAANERRYAAAEPGAYVPPTREPVTEAWGELGAQRDAETVHRLDLALAREQMHRAADQAALAVHGRSGGSWAWPRGDRPGPPQEWAETRAAARAAIGALEIPLPEPGATRPLAPGTPTRPEWRSVRPSNPR